MYTIWKDRYDLRKFCYPSIQEILAITWPYACTFVQTLREGEGSQEPARRGGEGVCYSWALACAKRAQRSTTGKKIWLSMHPRNFVNETIVRTSLRTSPLHVSRGEILHFKYPRVSTVNHLATLTLRDNENNNNKAEELEREITSKGDQFCWKNNMSENFID